jgi:integrase
MNQGLHSIGSATNLAEFLDSVYIPVVLPKMAKSTRERYSGVIKNYLKPQFGGLCLRDISTLMVDRYFSGFAEAPLDRESIDKIRDVLSGVMASAVRYGLLVKNPVEGVCLPRPKRGKKRKPWITGEQFDTLIALIPEPYATMVFVAIFTGLRVSELIGLRWNDVHSETITIDERCCRGDWGAPKSDSSNATVPAKQCVIERIHRLKTTVVEVKAGTGIRRYPAVKSCEPDDLVFQSVVKGVPMRDNNILTRHI